MSDRKTFLLTSDEPNKNLTEIIPISTDFK